MKFGPLKPKTIVGLIFYALIIFFLAFYLTTIDFSKIELGQINYYYLAVATVLAVFTRFVFAHIWKYFLTGLGAKIDKAQSRELVAVYAKAWLGRYIPGGITWVAGKIYFASQLGISKTKLAISSFLEALLQLVVVVATAAIVLSLDSRIQDLGPEVLWGLILMALLGLLVVIPPVFNRYAAAGYKLIRKTEISPENLPEAKAIVFGIGFFILTSLLSGLSLFFVAFAVFPQLTVADIWFVLGASNLASALSILAVFAPAGLGVREAIQLLALSVVMPAEQALVATVMMRLLSIIWDLMFLSLARVRK